GLTVSATDAAGITAKITLASSTAAQTQDDPFADANALGISGALSMNDVRGGATAYLDKARVSVTGGDVEVRAVENATLTAHLESATETSSSGGLFGDSSDTAINALAATNVVQSSATAYVSGGVVTTTTS